MSIVSRASKHHLDNMSCDATIAAQPGQGHLAMVKMGKRQPRLIPLNPSILDSASRRPEAVVQRLVGR